MSFSSRGGCSHERRAVFAALATLVTLHCGAAVCSGCAHARAGRPEPRRAPSAGVPLRANLDPSEEITPRELASIPEPVAPAARSTVRADTIPSSVAAITPAPKAAPEPSGAGISTGQPSTPSTEGTAPGGDSTSTTAKESVPPPPTPIGRWVWRVQIVATPDRALAERVAREAADQLGTTSRIDSEPPLFKVRLGAFGSEADAQVLKGRAVEMGYPGAFRVKIRVAATDE